MDPSEIVEFLRTRMYLIDIKRLKYETYFTIEEGFNNYTVHVENNLISCSCGRQVVCKHIRFILEKISKIKRKSKSYNSLTDCQRIFYIDLKGDLEPGLFISDRNPRYQEYKLLDLNLDQAYNGNCYICLSKLEGKILRCKECHTYYHENCIYAWLRCSVACTCPTCRTMWA